MQFTFFKKPNRAFHKIWLKSERWSILTVHLVWYPTPPSGLNPVYAPHLHQVQKIIWEPSFFSFRSIIILFRFKIIIIFIFTVFQVFKISTYSLIDSEFYFILDISKGMVKYFKGQYILFFNIFEKKGM